MHRGGLPEGTLTFLFTDLEGSTRLFEAHPVEMQEVMARHDELITAEVERRSGAVVKSTGDGVFAVFPTAVDAVGAAVALQLALGAPEWPDGLAPRVRMGLHSGDSVLRAGDYFGPEVNRAARIMSVVHGGQIVISAATAELAGNEFELIDLGPHRLRDLHSTLRLFQVAASGLTREFPPVRSLDAFQSNLPVEASEFVGRDAEVVALVELVNAHRLVSLVGVGGVGKTRLACRVGSELVPQFRDGVWLAELAAARSAAELLEVVATGAGYTPPQGTTLEAGLKAFLAHKHLLLILDNCEHLVHPAARFAMDVLTNAPGVSMLATSREALAVAGEYTHPLRPLGVPAHGDPDAVLVSESGALFELRAQEARSDFAVDADNAEAIRAICERLDGIPLAIELAAARTPAITPAEILERLDRQFRLLTGGSRAALERHQTLRAAIDWSHDLLDDNERAVFERCAVFVNGFDLTAASAVSASPELDDLDVLDAISSLVAKNLVECTRHGAHSRYGLLEMMRQYAAERLDEHNDAKRVRDAHADHYLRLVHDQFAAALGPADWDALQVVERETANVAAALRWTLDIEQAPQLLEWYRDLPFVDSVVISAPLMETLGRAATEATSCPDAPKRPGYQEACVMGALRAFIDGAMDEYTHWSNLALSAEWPTTARSFMVASAARMFAGTADEAIEVGSQAIDLARVSTTPAELAFTLALVALFEQFEHHDDAEAHAREAIEVARATRSRIPLLYPLMALAVVCSRTDPPQALAAAEEILTIDRSARRSWSNGCTTALSRVRYDSDDRRGALQLLRDTFEYLDQNGDRPVLSAQVVTLADLLAHDAPDTALRLAAIAETDAISPWFPFDFQPTLVTLAEQMPEQLTTARTFAASLDYDGALAYLFTTIDALQQRFDRA
jgi:predicted ATPase/class 3 adenylate cyclase